MQENGSNCSKKMAYSQFLTDQAHSTYDGYHLPLAIHLRSRFNLFFAFLETGWSIEFKRTVLYFGLSIVLVSNFRVLTQNIDLRYRVINSGNTTNNRH